MKLKKIILLLNFLFLFVSLQAQDMETSSLFRESGKIYVVVAILSVIFIGIVVYLVSLDKKISRMEDKLKNRNN